MGLPEYLESAVRTRRFWTDFFWITYADDDGYSWDQADLKFSVGNEFGLSVMIDKYISTIQLRFTSHDSTTHFLGYDDNFHWQPYTLRWPELETICQAISIADTTFSHPGLPLLFLARFAPICVGDDVDHIVTMLVRAWKQIGEDVLTDDQIRQVIERIDNRHDDLCWHYDKFRNYWWVGKGLDASIATKAYTYRRNRDWDHEEPFPNKEWTSFIFAAHLVVEESSLGGIAKATASSYERNMIDKFRPRKRYDLNITLELRTTERPLDKATVTCLLNTLEAVLQKLCLGKSGTLYQEGTIIDGKHIYIGICQPAISESGTNIICSLPIDSQTKLESIEVLRREANVKSPTALGWTTADTPDNGKIDFNFTRFPQGVATGEENTGAIVIRKVTPQVAALLHRLMAVVDLVLLPMLLVANPLPDNIACHFDQCRVVSPEELYETLSTGAYNWCAK
ncbi:hypothetical protein BKA59DRAFT_437847 [Fusarium tricinctum]|uniref:Uncharacterized protein n=1 Tax=Fusarium tricinctum TaxID=61284 RepID=A0A8K0S0Z5_9HYPO|nr:hypothetical protein BKA59DRAFT_437847 [Fusarium tricinctum]